MTTEFYETAQAAYRQKRYLEHASQDEMAERLNDICVNVYVFGDDGSARVRNTPYSMHFLALLAHFFEEMKLRRQPSYSFHAPNFHLDDTRYPKARRAEQLWKNAGPFEPGRYMLKFGQIQYLEPLLSEGRLRISPASSYKDDSLAVAIRDDELRFNQVVTGGTAQIRDKDGTVRTFPIHGPARLSHDAASNFYLSCYSALFENRLFDDFDADGCLVIKDVDRYCALLNEGMRGQLTNWKFSIGGVEYRDPYVPTRNPNLFVTKHMRYSYQREFRALWIPSEWHDALAPMHAELGNLSAFCELLRL
jgi:hypothetical protein